MRSALLALALLAAPALLSAQGQAGSGAQSDFIVVTAASVRVRTAPSMQSLSIDEFVRGTVFPLAPEEFQSKDWLGIALDGRLAFIPRYAVALKSRPRQPAPTSEPALVAQAGAPAAVSAPPPTAVQTMIATPRVAPNAAPAAEERAPLTAASPPADRVAERPIDRVQDRVPDRVAAAEPSSVPERTPERTPARTAETPVVPARRAGMDLTIGLLASVAQVEAGGLTPEFHVAGLSFFGAQYRGWGAYLAPEFGSGGGYRSTLLGGGLSRDLINAHLLRLTALAGYTTYAVTPTVVSGASAPATLSLRGPSMGGMASIPLFGPLRLAYRGQYIILQTEGVSGRATRHNVGLVF